MGKFKPVRPKKDKPLVPKAGVPCVILAVSGMVLFMYVLYLILKNANG